MARKNSFPPSPSTNHTLNLTKKTPQQIYHQNPLRNHQRKKHKCGGWACPRFSRGTFAVIDVSPRVGLPPRSGASPPGHAHDVIPHHVLVLELHELLLVHDSCFRRCHVTRDEMEIGTGCPMRAFPWCTLGLAILPSPSPSLPRTASGHSVQACSELWPRSCVCHPGRSLWGNHSNVSKSL